jgi:hypothetical protein
MTRRRSATVKACAACRSPPRQVGHSLQHYSRRAPRRGARHRIMGFAPSGCPVSALLKTQDSEARHAPKHAISSGARWGQARPGARDLLRSATKCATPELRAVLRSALGVRQVRITRCAQERDGIRRKRASPMTFSRRLWALLTSAPKHQPHRRASAQPDTTLADRRRRRRRPTGRSAPRSLPASKCSRGGA